MGFIIRCIFWLSMVLLFVPLDQARQFRENALAEMSLTVATVQSKVGDLVNICEDDPQICLMTKTALNAIVSQAQQSLASVEKAADQAPAEDKGITPNESVDAPESQQH